MDAAQAWRTAVTRSDVGTAVLGGALAVHFVLALYKTAQRSTWRMPAWEAVQIALGLAIPLLLVEHLLAMRGHHVLDRADTTYSETVSDVWSNSGLTQAVLLLVVWTHACIGLHFWLRLARFYRRAAPFLLAAAVLVPALALAGFVVAGRDAAELAATRQAAAQSPAFDDAYGAAAAALCPTDQFLAELETFLLW